MKREPLLWFRFRDRYRRQWSVWLTARDIDDFSTCPGPNGEVVTPAALTLYTPRRIIIDAGLAQWEQDLCVVHEFCHVTTESAETITQDNLELAIREISPVVLHAIRQLGFAIPRRPQGYALLASHARRINRKLGV